MGAEYYDDEYIVKKLLTINGDADQYDAMMERKASEEAARVDTAAQVEPLFLADGGED